ncbi:MAG: CHRD domain-containing protein [Aromatoleum sp.]|nr:CHRD domain-containing protein [Aromatoleum sp.]
MSKRIGRRPVWAIAAAFALAFAPYAGPAAGEEVKVTLSGSQEIPPVTTTASGTGTFAVDADRSVSGSVTVTGMTATVAHVHEAAAGTNGLIMIPLTKTSDTVWSVPPGIKLTDAQYASFKAGNLYYNVHSEAHRSGEIRCQIKP